MLKMIIFILVLAIWFGLITIGWRKCSPDDRKFIIKALSFVFGCLVLALASGSLIVVLF